MIRKSIRASFLVAVFLVIWTLATSILVDIVETYISEKMLSYDLRE